MRQERLERWRGDDKLVLLVSATCTICTSQLPRNPPGDQTYIDMCVQKMGGKKGELGVKMSLKWAKI